MKTEVDLQKEIDDNVVVCRDKETPLRKVKSTKKRISFLRHCKMYVQTEPTQDNIKRQLTKVNKELKVYADRFGDWCKSNQDQISDIKNILAYYNRINGISKLKDQAKTLKFILH